MEDKRDNSTSGHDSVPERGDKGDGTVNKETLPESAGQAASSDAGSSLEANNKSGEGSIDASVTGGGDDTGIKTPPVKSGMRDRSSSAVVTDGGLRGRLSWLPIQGPAGIFIISALALVLVLGLYFVFDGMFVGSDNILGDSGGQISDVEMVTIKVFYPVEDRVMIEERQVATAEDATKMGMVLVKAFLEGPSGGIPSYVPDIVEINGVYLGRDGNLYIDLTSAMLLNFQGDAVAEYLLLRSLYRTLSVNIKGVSGYRLLVDGREIDTVGGHIYIAKGLERAVSYRLLEEDEIVR